MKDELNYGYDTEKIKGIEILTIPSMDKRVVLNCFTTRNGGISKEPYQTLNLSLTRPCFNSFDVLQNYSILCNGLGIRKEEMVIVNFCHGDGIAIVDEKLGGNGLLYAFIPVNNKEELINLFRIVKYDVHPINELQRIAEKKPATPCRYIFQLSDLHFGAKSVDDKERRLKTLIKKQLSSIKQNDNVSFVITGDVVDSPNRRNQNKYLSLVDYIKEKSGNDPIRVYGNHDINNLGLSFAPNNQRIVNLTGDYPNIEVLEDVKVILLLFNSNTYGHLAEGEIGSAQMLEMGNKLDLIEDVDNYNLIAVLHHHLLPIEKPIFYDQQWYERIVPKHILERTLRLRDAREFIKWLHNRNVKIVLHGHKHIPVILEDDNMTIVGCGSSTGKVVHIEEGKTFMSYNLLKIQGNTVTCTQFAEEIYGTGVKNICTKVICL